MFISFTCSPFYEEGVGVGSDPCKAICGSKITKEGLKDQSPSRPSSRVDKQDVTAVMEEMQAKMEKLQDDMNNTMQQNEVSTKCISGLDSFEFSDDPIKSSTPSKSNRKKVFIRSRLLSAYIRLLLLHDYLKRNKMALWQDGLNGKVVMVTGASSGIGREVSINLAKAGCRIIVSARRVDKLKSLCNHINRSSNSEGLALNAIAVELDVTANGANIEAAVQIAWDAFGRIDALVNNAGVREEEWEHTFTTNLRGAWLVSKFVCRHMIDAKQGGGSIINVSSIAGLNRVLVPGGLAYASSKMALDRLTEMMALELGVHKIRVNSIAPGIFKSEMTESLIQQKWFHGVISRTAPLRTIGTTDPALTSLVRYLIHASSEYVSGNVFIVDSGATLIGVPIFSSL
ncbi:hypothetical protein RDI58_023800 [Solanum bulbocastanum]|uniref:2,4-dienoyl-CoA reductase n=1 Tax=Solanum bulbocastanum TaxID=147425 RepID=A0AAN8T3N0_SOLBU